MRSMLFAATIMFSLLSASEAFAVASRPSKHDEPQLPKVTTGAATRAEVDLQIRRLHHMLVSNSEVSEGTFDELERLEKGRRVNH